MKFSSGTYADTPVRRYAGTPIRRYADTPIRRYAGAPVRQTLTRSLVLLLIAYFLLLTAFWRYWWHRVSFF